MAQIKERMKSARRKKKMYTILAVCSACIAIGAAGYLFMHYVSLHRQETAFENLRTTELETESEKQTENETETTTEEANLCEPVYDFAQLKETNDDIYAWLTIPGTTIDYPVLQNEEDNFYLKRNLDRSSGYPGCIYTNKCNDKSFEDLNTILYGHNMRNGSMFASLHDYEDEENFEANRFIYVYTEEHRLTYEIYAAVKFSDVYIPEAYGTNSSTGKEQFLADLQTNADKYASVSNILDKEVLPEEKLITLSTCVYGEDTTRYLVVGVLIEVTEYTEK